MLLFGRSLSVKVGREMVESLYIYSYMSLTYSFMSCYFLKVVFIHVGYSKNGFSHHILNLAQY